MSRLRLSEVDERVHANKWLERTMLGVTSLADGKRRAARPPLSHTVGHT